MENIEEKGEEVLVITEEIRSYIYETAKWANFLSIVGFVMTAFVVMISFMMGSLMTMMNSTLGGEANNPYAAMGSGFLTVILLLSALIYFYLSLMLFKYATAAKQAVLYADQPMLAVAMSKMKSFFKFLGILTIVGLTMYALSFLLAIVAGVSAANAGG